MDRNTLFISIAGGVAGLLAAGWLAWVWWKLRARRRVTMATLHRLGQHVRLDDAQIKSYPAPTLLGTYFGYALAVECEAQKTGWRVRLHTELRSPWEGRLLMHGDTRPGRVRELYGMEIVLTGDHACDRAVLIAAHDEPLVQQLMNDYLRSRYRHLPHTHFQYDWHDRQVFAELHLAAADGLRPVPEHIDLLVLTSGMLDLLLASLPTTGSTP